MDNWMHIDEYEKFYKVPGWNNPKYFTYCLEFVERKSKHVGIFWDPITKKYVAWISTMKKFLHVGFYNTEDEAIKARKLKYAECFKDDKEED